MDEIWKPIKGYEGCYEISNYGNVRSLDRYVKSKCGGLRFLKGQILKLITDDDGYLRVGLNKNGKYYNYGVHRLVAEAFVPNPNNYPCVNHKDEIKSNNIFTNLEWCTNAYNLKFGHRLEKVIKKRKIPILQFTKEMEFVSYYESCSDAALINNFSSQGNINLCLKGYLKSAYGYIWKYV